MSDYYSLIVVLNPISGQFIIQYIQMNTEVIKKNIKAIVMNIKLKQ